MTTETTKQPTDHIQVEPFKRTLVATFYESVSSAVFAAYKDGLIKGALRPRRLPKEFRDLEVKAD